MLNDNCLRIFKERLALKAEKQMDELDRDIKAAKMQAAAEGLLQSGCMINGIKGLCVKVLESRVDYIFEILEDLPFKYSHNLGVMISEISLPYFPSSLDELYSRLDDIIKLANDERARESVINEVIKLNNTQIKRFRNLLDQFLLTLRSKEKSTVRSMWEHPVWSKVISGVILTIGAIIVKIVWEKLTK